MTSRSLTGALATTLLSALAAHAASSTPPLALEAMAERLADSARAEKAEPPVALFVHGASPDLARGLATELAAALARRGLPAFPIDAVSPAAAEVEARAAGARALMRLSVSIESGLLSARGDLLGTWVNFWSGATPTRPASPAAGLETSVEADAHALALAAVSLSPLPVAGAPQTGPLKLIGATFARLPLWSAALASGDLDGDGRDEAVVLTDEEILAFTPEGRLLARREHRALPSAASPSREPFGAVAVHTAEARVSYLSARRARGEKLTLERGRGGFRAIGTIDAAPMGRAGPLPIQGKLVSGLNTFEPALELGTDAKMTLPRAFTTLSTFNGPAGAELLAVFPDGTGLWRQGLAPEAATAELRGLGAASALADVDGDGRPEVITTEPSFAPEPEVLRVLRSPALGDPAAAEAVRFRLELPRGRALQATAADLDGDHVDEVIVALWLPDGTTELRVFRRVP